MKRPLSVTMLTVGVLIFAVEHLLRAYEAVRQWNLLSALPLTVSPLYLALTGLVWGVAGLVLVMGLWRAKPWSLHGTVWLLVVYVVYDGVDRLILARNPARLSSWPFFLGLMLVFLILVIWIRSRSPVKLYFGVLHDRQSEDQKPT